VIPVTNTLIDVSRPFARFDGWSLSVMIPYHVGDLSPAIPKTPHPLANGSVEIESYPEALASEDEQKTDCAEMR